MQSAAVVALFDSLHVGKASYTKCYTIMVLFFNVAYGVWVPARNDFGLSVPQFSTPVTVASPDKPQDVFLLGPMTTAGGR